MKKRTLQFLTIAFLVVGITGCGGVSQGEYNALKAENEALKKELEELKFGPEKLLSLAKVHIENKDLDNAKVELQNLLEKHPTSKQATEARRLASTVDNSIRQQKLAEETAERERLANATNKLLKTYDDIKEITWYCDAYTPQGRNNSFYLYMGQQKGGEPWLRVKIQYAADELLSIKSFIVKTDNESYTINTSYGEVETDVDFTDSGSGCFEWYDVSMTKWLYNVVKDIISSESVKLRYNGSQYYRDRVITETEKQGLKNVLDAYEALGGRASFRD